VYVDKTRCEDLPLRIDRGGCFGTTDFTDSSNVPVFDGNVCLKPGVAAAINNTSVLNDEIVGRYCWW